MQEGSSTIDHEPMTPPYEVEDFLRAISPVMLDYAEEVAEEVVVSALQDQHNVVNAEEVAEEVVVSALQDHHNVMNAEEVAEEVVVSALQDHHNVMNAEEVAEEAVVSTLQDQHNVVNVGNICGKSSCHATSTPVCTQVKYYDPVLEKHIRIAQKKKTSQKLITVESAPPELTVAYTLGPCKTLDNPSSITYFAMDEPDAGKKRSPSKKSSQEEKIVDKPEESELDPTGIYESMPPPAIKSPSTEHDYALPKVNN